MPEREHVVSVRYRLLTAMAVVIVGAVMAVVISVRITVVVVSVAIAAVVIV